ncbi:MAG: hypothetical protein JSR09_00175 [Bacteroidetes bacterium]|nr:hypothetical protein [Bacteroidota bacterium]MBS1648099.1 hypothetical protein [Bacteroidota bacterium]
MKRQFAFILLFIVIGFNIKAQDTLPKFSVKELAKEKVLISWINPFANCNQLMVQRSYDSLQFFKTIYSAQSPTLPQNGFVDVDITPGIKAYYRIFYVLEDGGYFFTKSIPLFKKNAVQQEKNTTDNNNQQGKETTSTKVVEKKYITVYKQTKDSVLRKIEVSLYKKFKDSIATQTKDTLYFFSNDEIIWKPYIPKPVWKPSSYVFTDETTYVIIFLPQYKIHKYRIKFFEEDGKDLFEIKHINEEKLILDKTNFIHSGWFNFELYEDDKLKEKNKVFLVKDF